MSLPVGWTYSEQGNTMQAPGSISYSPGTGLWAFTLPMGPAGFNAPVDADGTGLLGGIAGTYGFAYAQASGDCSITVKVATAGSGGFPSGVGVAFESSLAVPNDVRYQLIITGNNSTFNVYTGYTTVLGGSDNIRVALGPISTVPQWLKITRTFATGLCSAFVSSDGITFTQVGSSVVCNFGPSLYLGIKGATANNNAAILATLNNVSYTSTFIPPGPGGLYQQPGSPGSSAGANNNPNPTSNTGASNVLGYAPGSLVGTSPTTTSNVTGWLPDILTICQEAAEHASVDATTAYFLRSAKRSLDYLGMSWANYGLNLWTLDEQSTVLTPGTALYAMPQDTMDLISPAISITSQSGQTIQTMVARQDFESYLSIPNKAVTGKPNTIFVQRSQPAPQMFVWPVPDVSQVYTLVWWRLHRMQNTGYATNGMEVPFRFVPAITYGLAWQLAVKKKVKDYNLIAMLKMNYDAEFERAREEDRDRSPIFFSPYISFE